MGNMSSPVIDKIFQVEKEAASIVEEATSKAAEQMHDLQKQLERELQEHSMLLKKRREQALAEMDSHVAEELAQYRKEILTARLSSESIAGHAQNVAREMMSVLLSSQLDDEVR